MDKAAARVKQALSRREHIAVFGDYDVDGITATCLLTEYLRSKGGQVTSYIPARLEEGYGLNPIAIDTLKKQGVELIVTVDCGITANKEAALCRELGIDLVITDHHECKSELPQAAALVDPHRRDQPQPAAELAGVGVAFKLAAAIEGEQETLLDQYCDFLCLGTVADVMPLTGENRTMVARGLKALENPKRVGIAALMAECSVQKGPVTAGTIGYTLAPRINAAGRMGEVEIATELFLTRDAGRAVELAGTLCRLNRRRQEIESSIYQSAVSMLPPGGPPQAIVLADESWHQGVVGIVASRMAEEYSCPTFLICLDGDKGKASSRSYGGFNLFRSLEQLSGLLESYGGHELAAGFTIRRESIAPFREKMITLCAQFQESEACSTALAIDCEIPPELLLEKAASAGQGDSYESITYEGHGPSGVAVIVETMTDNRNRTAGNIRHHFDKYGGSLGVNGCVSWAFDKKGVIVIDNEDEDLDEDTVMMDALDAGAADFQPEEGCFTIYTDPADFNAVAKALEEKGYKFESAQIEMVPQTYQKLEKQEDRDNMEKMLDLFEDDDDVQNVWHNWDNEE